MKITSEEDQYELVQCKADSESSEYSENGEIEESSYSEEENFLKVCRNKKKMRFFLFLIARMKGLAFRAHPKM